MRKEKTEERIQRNTSWTLKGFAPGTYYWSVQAVDTGFMAGPTSGVL